MEVRKMSRMPGRCVALVALGLCLSLAGCRERRFTEIRVGPERGKPADKALDTLAGQVLANSRAIETLTADIEVALVSPLLREPSQLHFSGGRLAVKKMTRDDVTVAAVRLHVRHHRSEGIMFSGDGTHYEVNMPVLKMSYGGAYGSGLRRSDNRIHFTPVEVAHVFNLEGLMMHRPRLLRAYPPHWDHSAVGAAGPVELPAQWPVEFPPLWVIDLLEIDMADDDAPFPWVHSSVVLDRRTERPLRIETFRPDGSLMTRVWIQNERVVRTSDRRSVHVPSEVMIWYPPPLENTVVRLRLSNIRINEPLEDRLFGL